MRPGWTTTKEGYTGRVGNLERSALVLLVLAGGATVAALPASSLAFGGPEPPAREFVESVQKGDLARAKQLLESPRFRSVPLGGDDAYFIYESAHQPNLAFLVGHPFEVGRVSVTTERSDWYLIDGTLYATVTFPLRFRAARYQPFVLPPYLAFGRPMTSDQLTSYLDAPDRYPADFTLRLRPGIEPGLIGAPRAPMPQVKAPPPPPGPPGAQPLAAPRTAGFASYPGLGVAVPRDTGPVLLPSGEALPRQQLEALLPRLDTITLEVYLVRRGRLAAWRVSWLHVPEATVVTARGAVTVKPR